MRWYGVEVSKFCGVSVGSGAPTVIPIFNVIFKKVAKKFNVNVNEYEVETMSVKFKKKIRSFSAEILDDDLEVMNIALKKNKKNFIVFYS